MAAYQTQPGAPSLIRIVGGARGRTMVEVEGTDLRDTVLSGDGHTVVIMLYGDTRLNGESKPSPAGLWAVDAGGGRSVFSAWHQATGETFLFGYDGAPHIIAGPLADVRRAAISGDGSTVLALEGPLARDPFDVIDAPMIADPVIEPAAITRGGDNATLTATIEIAARPRSASRPCTTDSETTLPPPAATGRSTTTPAAPSTGTP